MAPWFNLNSGDVAGFKLLASLALIYGLMSILVHSVIHMKFIKPLALDAPLDRFSEARAIEHVRVLSKDIDGRQVGRQGLQEAAGYIKTQLEMLKARAGSNIRIEIEEDFVSGSFNMVFLGHSLSLGYKNLTNIAMRVSSVDSQETEPSVLLNAHFDSPPGSPGAADCGSCVASLLEMARFTIDSGWVPPRPLIFLFNGAEELFMLGSHGFMTTHKWRDTIGAFINFEATGTGGPDVVCQSGPQPLPSLIYAQSALYPMGNSAAQDVFGIAPGDTDYRIFASDHGNIPGLDIIFLLGGYFYHTASDTVERLLPGSIQARGDNLITITKAFTNSSKLQNARERASYSFAANDERPVYFDYLSWFLIYYTRRQATFLHSIPIAIFLLMPFLLRFPTSGFYGSFTTFFDFMKGMLLHITGIILAVIFPGVFAIVSLLFPGHSMNWFANPYLAFMMFVPSSLVGLLAPRMLWRCFPLSQDFSLLKSSKEELGNEAKFWGAFGFYAILTFGYHAAGLGGGFVSFFLSSFMLPAWFSFCMSAKYFGHQSLRSAACYVVPLMPWLLYSIYFCAILVQFLVEKMGMIGSLPPPYGYFVPDILVAATIGGITGLCVGPLVPIIGHWLARSSVMVFLLHITVLALVLSSQFFPYSNDAPKRVVLQHTVLTTGILDGGQILESSFDISVLDSNSLHFLFKHAPEVAGELRLGPELSFETSNPSNRESWMAIYPLSSLFSRSLKFPAKTDEILTKYKYFPDLSLYRPCMISDLGSRRIYLEFSLGSLEEVWVAVLNITGPLSNWSLANNILPAPEVVDGGPPSYICRLSGAGHENWNFWLEASFSEEVRVEVGVVDQYLMESAKKLKGLFPNWVDVTAYTSYLSSYVF